jgi:glyoxylase-like metal-dependent hydrolase (beta-lactamase superfamily II)
MKTGIIHFALAFLIVTAQGCGTKQGETEKNTLDIAINGLGGAEILNELNGFSVESERDEFLMGQGPEPGKGIMRLAGADTTVFHNLNSGAIKIDVVTTLAARAGGYLTREINTLLIGEKGYLSEIDAMGIDPNKNKPLSSDIAAATAKTEKLLNPHLLIKDLMNGKSTLSNQNIEVNVEKGHRYKQNEVMPVTIDRIRQTGKRTLIATEEWENIASKKSFFPKMINKTIIDPGWFSTWQRNTQVDESLYDQITIASAPAPITLFVSRKNGLIEKLTTMEWDAVYGDIELEVTYDDWKSVQGVSFPMIVRMSQGGAPRWEVRRKNVTVNPSYLASTFKPPEGILYVHDESAAQRGRELSQTIRAFGFAGARRPDLNSIELETAVYLLSAAPLDGIYTMVVEQENGIVVIEPGMNDLKGEEIVKWIKGHFNGKPITHLVVTHHHNDHAAGIRPYVAAGAALVVHETAIDFYRTQINRTKSIVVVDALDRVTEPGTERIVGIDPTQKFLLNDKTHPVAIYPVFNGHTEDMVIAVLESEGIIYGGDLYVSGVARDLRSGTKRPANVLPYHSAVSLNDTIRAFDIQARRLVGSHDKQPVTYQNLLDYITD